MTVIRFSPAEVYALQLFIGRHLTHDALQIAADGSAAEAHCPPCGSKIYVGRVVHEDAA